uniref:competence protein CoiA family protein n=1 Tax=Vibrio vulnificus TaxID=672 RepID=UPI002B477B28
MLLQHVPFGLRIQDQTFVDVADVVRGKNCGCICPSCHTPLIARQGEEKQWHFAHASRKVEGTDKECDFSFFVSVRMMARQARFQIISATFMERCRRGSQLLKVVR